MATSIAATVESFYRSALNAYINAHLTGTPVSKLFPDMHIQVSQAAYQWPVIDLLPAVIDLLPAGVALLRVFILAAARVVQRHLVDLG